MFTPGQKVQCVDAGPLSDPFSVWLFDVPVEGAVYTVVREFIDRTGLRSVYLEEIRNFDPTRGDYPDGYAAERFRPLAEPKTDISIFRRMLKPTDATIDA